MKTVGNKLHLDPTKTATGFKTRRNNSDETHFLKSIWLSWHDLAKFSLPLDHHGYQETKLLLNGTNVVELQLQQASDNLQQRPARH